MEALLRPVFKVVISEVRNNIVSQPEPMFIQVYAYGVADSITQFYCLSDHLPVHFHLVSYWLVNDKFAKCICIADIPRDHKLSMMTQAVNNFINKGDINIKNTFNNSDAYIIYASEDLPTKSLTAITKDQINATVSALSEQRIVPQDVELGAFKNKSGLYVLRITSHGRSQEFYKYDFVDNLHTDVINVINIFREHKYDSNVVFANNIDPVKGRAVVDRVKLYLQQCNAGTTSPIGLVAIARPDDYMQKIISMC